MSVDTLAFDAPPNAGQSHGGCAAFDASLIGARVSARPSLCVEWRELARLTDIVAQWSALAARALERNVFYEPAFALAAAPVFGRNVHVVLVWEDATRQRLIGFFPAVTEKRRYGLPLPILGGWTHPYAPLGAPLVDAEHAAAVLDAWLGFVAPQLLLLPFMPTDGPFALALQDALLRRGGAARAYDAHARALLAPRRDRQTYLDASVSGKRRKELRRQAKRLEQEGAVTLVQARGPLAVTEALEDYLRLEAAGWKGRAGTAAAIHPHICAFLRNAVTGLAASGQAGVTRLMLGEQTIAAGVTLRSGPRAWFWKIAYDEARAAASPGVQLSLAMTQDLLADDTITAADSCATADHPMIGHIWRERLALADLLVAPVPATRRFDVACLLESMRRAAIRILRSAKRKLRG